MNLQQTRSKCGISLFLLLLYVVGMCNSVNAQQECNIAIVGDYEPACLLPLDKEYIEEYADALLACKGSTVNYTVYCYIDGAQTDSCRWYVNGASEVHKSGRNTICVTWGEDAFGEISVTAVSEEGDSCMTTRPVRLIDSPVAGVTTVPEYEVENRTLMVTVCRGTVVSFSDASDMGNSDMASSVWDNSLEGTSGGLTYTFVAEKNTTVIHRVENNCGCWDEVEILVKVVELPVVSIGCYGTACEGSLAHYYVESPSCSQYSWFVEGGEIISGQDGADVQVLWNEVEDGYGVVGIDGSLCSDRLCPYMMKVKVPVIQNLLPVEGAADVCEGDVVVYSLPQFGSTSYNWQVAPQNGVQIYDDHETSRITYRFTRPGTYKIWSDYYCEFLDCGPYVSDTLSVVVKPVLKVTGDDMICYGSSCELSCEPYLSVDWTVYDVSAEEIVATVQNASDLSYMFPHPGRYSITASHPDYCPTEPFQLTVRSAPPAPTAGDLVPENPHVACPYRSIGLKAHPRNYTTIWEPVCEDASPQQISGEEVTIQYDEEVCDIRLYNYEPLTGCRSTDYYLYEVEELVLEPVSLPTTPITVTEGSSIDWTNGQVPYQEGVLYRWFMDPDKQNYGSLMGSELSNSAVWIVNRRNNIPNDDSFMVTIEREGCEIDTRTVTIHVLPVQSDDLQINLPGSVCAGETITLTGTGGNSASYWWEVNGVFVGVGNDVRYTIPEATVERNYEITLLSSSYDEYSGAQNQSSVTETLSVHPQPAGSLFYDRPNNQLRVTSSNSGYSYSWWLNEIPLSNTTSSIDNPTEGVYRCVVTDLATGCTKELTWWDESAPSFSCQNTEWASSTYSHCSHSATLRVPADATDISWSVSGIMYDIEESETGHCATVTFNGLGTGRVTAYYMNNGQCCHSSYDATVAFIPDFDLELKCDNVEIHNKSILAPNMEMSMSISKNGTVVWTGSITDRTISVPLSAQDAGTCVFRLSRVGDHNLNCSIGTVTYIPVEEVQMSITTSNTRNPGFTCELTPIQLRLETDPQVSVEKIRWDFGDDSWVTTASDNVWHTFGNYDPPAMNNYTVHARVTTTAGCVVPDVSLSVRSYRTPFYNNISYNYDNGNISINELLQILIPTEITCPIEDSTRVDILYLISSPATNCRYHWNAVPSDRIDQEYYQTHYTYNYVVQITDTNYCKVEKSAAVTFKNRPEAVIFPDKTQYCIGDEIRMTAATGPDTIHNQYHWTVTCAEMPSTTTTYQGATIHFRAQYAGEYHISLTVSNDEGCSNHTSATVRVNPQPPALSIYNNDPKCIGNPPVELHAHGDYENRALWNNGSYGATASYYTAGPVTVYYVDTLTGCVSATAGTTIEPAPQFDALLTGCYEVCENVVDQNASLSTWGLISDNHRYSWRWMLNSYDLARGTSTSNPLQLPLNGFGEYWMSMDYNNDTCRVESPLLKLTQTKFCKCDDLEVNYHYQIYTDDCEPTVLVTLIVCNHSQSTLCIDEVGLQSESLAAGMSVHRLADMSNHPDHLMPGMSEWYQLTPGACDSLQVLVEMSDLLCRDIPLRITDNCNLCTKDVLISVDWNTGCEENVTEGKCTLNSGLSSPGVGYFNFQWSLESADNVFYVVSEPPLVIDASATASGTGMEVSGLLMMGIETLRQLAQDNSMICITALVCDNDQLCRYTYCVSSRDLLILMLQEFSDDKGSVSGMEGDGGNEARNEIRLSPNPASGMVYVEASHPVTEILVMDMHGIQVAHYQHTNVFDVSALVVGSYIVKVTESLSATDQKTEYLKLVRQ